ncbi:response regulator [bacterium]|nr:MAG: response regulator [bacterium]
MARILVVDDEKNILALYKEELSEEGYEVTTAASAKEALELLEKDNFDAVILDIRMPEEDGISALEKMMVKRRDLPVLINTAYSTYKDNFLTWLAEDYIIKSADLSELKDKIKHILKKKGKA